MNPEIWGTKVLEAVGVAVCGFNILCARGWMAADNITRSVLVGLVAGFVVYICLDAHCFHTYGLSIYHSWVLRKDRGRRAPYPGDDVEILK